MQQIISQLHILDYINVLLIMFLMAFGFIIKHMDTKIKNSYIPAILLVVAMIYEFVSLHSYDSTAILNAIVDGIISAAISIGLHSSGKEIFKSILSDKTLKSALVDSITDSSSNEEEEESEEEVDDEDLNE